MEQDKAMKDLWAGKVENLFVYALDEEAVPVDISGLQIVE
jgi:hypothetical protein